MRKLLVLEANEIPLGLLQWYASRAPGSAIASLLRDADVTQTINNDELGSRDLYPSQTWGTIATGVAFDQHQIYWYGDPKPAAYPLYWQAAAPHRSVGVFGAIHSSLEAGASAPQGYSFFFPDAFSASPATKPDRLSDLQAFNLDMTRANSRAVTSTRPVSKYARGLVGAVRGRTSLKTLSGLARTAVAVARGTTPRERLRTAQFELLADAFGSSLRETDPDLAVFFTNHVAAAMHRYWYASFPTDWEEDLFDDAWVRKFEGELPAALDSLDRFLSDLVTYCEASDRTLLLISSMGQKGGAPLNETGTTSIVVSDPKKFLASLGISSHQSIRHSMVPHVCVAFDTPADALHQSNLLERRDPSGETLQLDVAGNVLTISYSLSSAGRRKTSVAGQVFELEEIGAEEITVEEHRCGVHDPLGTLIVANSPTSALGGEVIDARDVAPAILSHLDIEPLAHHRQAPFKI